MPNAIAALPRPLEVPELRRFRSLTRGAADLVVLFDESRELAFASRDSHLLKPYPVDTCWSRLIEQVHDADRMRVLQALNDGWSRPGSAEKLEFRLLTDAGTRFVSGRVCNMLQDADVRGVAVYLSDVTERWTLDELTELHSRAWFIDRLERANAAHRETGTRFAVLHIRLNRFQEVRQGLGADTGDELLRSVASRLRSRLRRSDPVARLGEHTFGVLVERIQVDSDAEGIASCVEEAIDRPFLLGGHEIRTTVSVGIVPSQSGNDCAEEILQAAAAAVRGKPPRGRSHHTLYKRQMQEQDNERLLIELELRSALSRDEFHLVYQPIHDVQADRLAGCEALIRWVHPERGFISPGLFIPIAEEAGLINAIGEWVLREAFRQARRWRELGLEPPRISINVSADQLTSAFLTLVDEIVAETETEPTCIKLEVTETSIIDSPEEATDTLLALKERGFELALDDFGTGFSSLSYLHRFPFDTIKIDRAFIKNLGTPSSDGKDATLVRTIVGLGRNLEMSVVAEGIETEEQLAIVTEWGCDYGQGYYLARPMKADQLTERIVAAQ